MTILGRGGGYGYFLEPHNLQYKELFLASLKILKRTIITKRKQYTLQYTLFVIFTCTLCPHDQTLKLAPGLKPEQSACLLHSFKVIP